MQINNQSMRSDNINNFVVKIADHVDIDNDKEQRMDY